MTRPPQDSYKPTKAPQAKEPYPNPPKEAPDYEPPFAFPNAGHSEDFPGFPSFNIGDGEFHDRV